MGWGRGVGVGWGGGLDERGTFIGDKPRGACMFDAAQTRNEHTVLFASSRYWQLTGKAVTGRPELGSKPRSNIMFSSAQG